MRRIWLSGLVAFCLIVIHSSPSIGNGAITDVENDGLRGKVKTIESIQVKMQPDAVDPTLCKAVDDPKIVYQASYDEQGRIIRRMIDFHPVYIEKRRIQYVYYDYLEYIIDHMKDMINSGQLDEDSYSSAYSSSCNYDSEGNVEFIKVSVNRGGVGIKELSIVNKYRDGNVIERDIFDERHKEVWRRTFFIYTVSKTKPTLKNVIVRTCSATGEMCSEKRFIFNEEKRSAEVIDDTSTTKCFFDKNNNLTRIEDFQGEERTCMVKYRRDAHGILLEKVFVNYEELWPTKYKYEYEFDTYGNPIKIMVYVSAEKFKDIYYELRCIQTNRITYYN